MDEPAPASVHPLKHAVSGLEYGTAVGVPAPVAARPLQQSLLSPHLLIIHTPGQSWIHRPI